jgi:hypothetical protein
VTAARVAIRHRLRAYCCDRSRRVGRVLRNCHHVDDVRVLRVLSQNGEVYYPNQSVDGLLNRWMVIADPKAYDCLNFESLSPFNVFYGGTLVASVLWVDKLVLTL